MAIWINTGTISISAGGTTVTGSGTSFLTGGTQKGDMFQAPDGREYEITNIVSDTQLSIYKAYQGTTVSGSTNWDIIPTQGYVKALVDEVREYVETNNTIVDEISTTGLSIAHGGTGATTASGARTNLGLGNVNNTSDLNKPISTATQTALDGKLGLTATAADSAKLGGVAPDGYVKKADINGMVGNLSAPLTHLPLKKNLLTQQGQSVATFTRSTIKYSRDRYGVLKSYDINTPVFNENGLNVEGASTNNLTYSEQFDNAAWGKTRSSITANAILSPDGINTTADKLVEDSTVSSSHYLSRTFSFVAGTYYTFSVFAKKSERDITLRLPSGAFGENKHVAFDLTNGTYKTIAGTPYNSGMIKYANGYYRCFVTELATASASATFEIFLLSDYTNGVTAYTGNGVSGAYLFGAQLEALPLASSYIPTTSTSASRDTESDGTRITVPLAGNMPDVTKDFTVVMDVMLYDLTDTFQSFFTITNTTNFDIRYSASALRIAGLTDSSSLAFTDVNVLTPMRIGITYSASTGTLKLFKNGILKSSATGKYFYPLSSATSGIVIGSSQAYFSIRNLLLFERCISDSVMEVA